MRTTVTIDPDTEAMLKEEVRRTGSSFKEALNRSIRRGLGRQEKAGRVKVVPLFSRAFPPDIASANFNHLADDLDDARTLDELGE